MALLILLPAAFAQAQVPLSELQIEADAITGADGSEMRATNAVLTYRDIKLEAESLRFDSVNRWVVAEQGAVLTDGTGNRLRADLLSYYPALGQVTATGKVEFAAPGGELLRAGRMEFLFEQELLKVEEGLSYQDEKGYELEASSMEYSLAAQRGFAVDVVMTVPGQSGAITAGRIELGPEQYDMEDASYTSCMPDDPDWLLTASSISVGSDNVLRAESATLRVLDLPVMHLPRLSARLVQERRSGFLAPQVLVRSGGEYNVRQPFYLNLAPNYDALLSAQLINGRGVLAGVDGRWLFHSAQGTAALGLIRDERTEGARGSYDIEQEWALSEHRRLELRAAWLSDDDYADDFFSGLATARRHYAKEARFAHDDGRDSYGLAVTHYQTIKEETGVVERPFGSQPQLWFRTRRAPGGGLGWDAQADFDYFVRGDADPLEGFRLHTDIAVNGSRQLGLNLFDAQLGVANSVYEQDDSNWTVPYAGLRLRRKYGGAFNLNGRDYAQQMEPSVFLGLVRREDFADVPLYDTKAAEFSAQDLYQVNSYIGGDRFEDSSLIAYGLSTYVWHQAGRRDHLFEAHVAQRYRFADSRIAPEDVEPQQAGFSNLLVEGNFYPNEANTLKGRFEWDPSADVIGQVALAYQHRALTTGSYVLRYLRNVDEARANDDGQASLGLYRNLGTSWSMAGDVTYDIEESQMSQFSGGLRYISDCRCWNADFYVERAPLAARDRTTYFFQVNLLGLGDFGDDKFDLAADRAREPI